MSRPTSLTSEALQALYKGGLIEQPSLHAPQAQSDKADDNTDQPTQLDLDRSPQHAGLSGTDVSGQSSFAQTQFSPYQDGDHPQPISRSSRASPPPSYLVDPRILADDAYHGRATVPRDSLTSILPKPTSTGGLQGSFPARARNSQPDILQKRSPEDDLIDPRLSKAPKHGYNSFPSVEVPAEQQRQPVPNVTSGDPTYIYPAPSNSTLVQDYNVTSHIDVDHSLIDSATDALLERQMDLRDGSEEESESDYRRRTQRGRRGRRGGRGGRTRGAKRGPRKAAEPTGDVKYRINKASEAYVSGQLDEAIKFVEEAIRINAETYRAWTLLATCLEEKGDPKGSFTARVFSCHLQPKNVEGWLHCADLGIALRDELPDDAAHFLEQASICYSAALRADISNQRARHSRAAISFERGQIRTAAKDYLYLLEHGGEYDVHALRSYAEMTIILASTRKRSFYKPESAINWYRRAFDHFQANVIDEQLQPLEWQDINIFVGLLAYIEHTKEALFQLKSLARWLLGRSNENFWDDWQDDDREWDVDNVRRTEFQNFEPRKYPESSYGSGLPLDLRTKLGVYRLKLGDLDEAQRHIDHVDPEGTHGRHVLSNEPHLLAEIGTALYDSDLRAMTLRFFEPLLSIPDVLDSAALLAAGRCYLDAGDKRQAEECFGAAIDVDESNDEAAIDARYELAKMYEAAREEQEAYILVNEAIRLQQAHDEAEVEDDEEDMDEYQGSDDDARNRSGAARKVRPRNKNASRRVKPRAPKSVTFDKDGNEIRRPRPRRKLFGRSEEVSLEEKRRAEELATAWRTVHGVRETTDNDKRIGPPDAFMRAAKELVDDFRSCKGFYSWEKYLVHLGINEDKQVYVSRNRNLIEMKERLSHNLNPFEPHTERQLGERTAVSYRGVSFSDWLELFLEYAVGLAHNEKFQESYQVCESARDAEVFAKNRDDMFLIHVTWAACALRARDEETCVAAARFLMRDRQFDSDPFRMFAALCRLCPSPASWYASGPVQKYMLRQIKLMDRALVSGGGEDSDEEDTKANGGRVYPSKELDITLLVLYGHILFVSNSFTYALNYFLRAYSIDPTNQMVLLSVGQCYIHYALKRQSENRQYLLVQGFVFLHRYYDLKVSSADAAQRQEAHYNMARSYHAIGIPHLAAQFYQRVLRDIPDDSEPSVLGISDLSKEAAYNLQQICWAGGDLHAVKCLGERYLTL
ncbi:hypothetical protein F5B22DRAFT_168251 [Xylaria bambusicola]|uniref:uncharacterized protein n=1 Tax=Xylaria bambusicola TaxID=326684 RepID=UPI002007AF10|nr:uncharacterized protein F5B22DRAFT_168251 [Xylaria bambusicola]KAI0526612.1 hypothetical protein F5B22DRAFT_168251 [Xylaria bambusicola]